MRHAHAAMRWFMLSLREFLQKVKNELYLSLYSVLACDMEKPVITIQNLE
jgi:hypothetical protein